MVEGSESVAVVGIAGDTEEEDDGIPRCEDCRHELTWRDSAYGGAETKTCKGCRAKSARAALKGDYVKIHRQGALNHDGRRVLGIGNGEAMRKRQARAAKKRDRHEARLARLRRERAA